MHPAANRAGYGTPYSRGFESRYPRHQQTEYPSRRRGVRYCSAQCRNNAASDRIALEYQQGKSVSHFAKP